MKKAYLTIDDAPTRDFVAKTDFLYEHHIPALLFCEGRYMQQRPAEVCTAIQRGFVIGNHAFTHPGFSSISIEECKREISETDQMIEELYQQAGTPRPAKYFRFPYFDSGAAEGADKHEELQQYLQGLGYRQPQFEGINAKYFTPSLLTRVDVRCTYDQAEYWFGQANVPAGAATSEAGILARIEADSPYDGLSLNCADTNDVILLHDHEYTTDLFFKIMQRYLDKKIEFLQIPL